MLRDGGMPRKPVDVRLGLFGELEIQFGAAREQVGKRIARGATNRVWCQTLYAHEIAIAIVSIFL